MPTPYLAPPLPPRSPQNLAEAAAAVTALRDAAAALDRRNPSAALALRRRAAVIADAAIAAQETRRAASIARGRWARRPYKSGPLRRPGTTHVTVFGLTWLVTDTRHPTLCGRILTGRGVEFGVRATPGDDAPDGWTPVCTPCVEALAALQAPTAVSA